MFDNINKFDRVFVILTGNSINSITKEQWEKLKNECTIGTNHTFKVFDRPTYLFFSDKDVMYAVWDYYKDKRYNPIIYARDRSIYKKTDLQKYPEQIPPLWIEKNVDETWSEKERIIPKEYNITPIWLFSCLIEKNYKGKIYLIGADFYIEKEDNVEKYHFQNYHIDYYKKRKLEKKLQDFKKYFEAPFFDGKLNIYNCNPNSALEKFPKVELDKVLNE